MYKCWVIGDGALTARCGEILLRNGRALLGIVTGTAQVAEWARDRDIDVLDPADLRSGSLGAEPFDYLFSIVNMRILPPEILALPTQQAINFHDGPLPFYAGVHCTSWAILDGADRYAVSWHRISGGVDEGPILAQEWFDVADRETAYSLNTKCYGAGARTFEQLDAALAAGSAVAKEQDLSKRSYFGMFQHADALLDWAKPAAKLDALVRAGDFGSHPNLFGSARVSLGGGYFRCAASEPVPKSDHAQPGEILEVGEAGLVVAASEGALRITSITTLDGAPVDFHTLQARHGVRAGQRLPLQDPAQARRLGKLTEKLSRREAHWVKALETFSPRALPGASDLAVDGDSDASVSVEWETPQAWRSYVASTGRDEGAWLRLAVAAFLARLIGEESFDVAWSHPGLSNEIAEFRALFFEAAPLAVRLSFQAGLPAQYDSWKASEDAGIGKGSCLRDLPSRYPDLRALAGRDWVADCPLALQVVDSQQPNPDRSRAKAALTCQLDANGSAGRWIFHPNRFSAEVATEMIGRLTSFLEGVAASPETPLGQLPILSPEQRALQLVAWNQTSRPLPGGETVVSAFERQARLSPQATAVVSGAESLTYAKLDARANALAARLRTLGVGPDAIVGLCLERGADMVVAMLGILKAGGAYLPLDPNYPADRVAYMLEDSDAPVLVTEPSLEARFEGGRFAVVLLDGEEKAAPAPGPAAAESNLAYVIYTSGSTGKPKGVMVEHRNAINFFVAMDAYVEKCPGATWLAVTSLSFDISVLEILYSLTRGFEVVVHAGEVLPSGAHGAGAHSSRPIDFSLFYFSADQGEDPQQKYRLLIEGAKFADEHGFSAVWTPERHFHNFGGLYPNPSVTSAALAMITRNVQLRSGSVVAPLHSPIRIAEEWSVVDNLSNGRAGISFASGWMPEDFAIRPDAFAERKKLMMEAVDAVRRLWRGEAVSFPGPLGDDVAVKTLPRPIQAELPVWITTAGNPETFAMAGQAGAGVLTHLLGQSLAEVAEKIAAYRQAWKEAGHAGRGWVSLMLHTFVADSDETAVRETEQPLKSYLRTSADLLKKYSWSFPTFKRASADVSFADLPPAEMEALLDHAYKRYFETSGLFGTPEGCTAMVSRLKEHDVDEIACLVDFGIPVDTVLENLPRLGALCADTSRPHAAQEDNQSVAALIRRHGVTHFQCTPSMVAMLMQHGASREALAGLRQWFIGGEAFPGHLASDLCALIPGGILNMYGPTETTVWSTVHPVADDDVKTPVGRPIANTSIYILDNFMQPVPVGAPGELFIGGDGVVRGYLNQPELTAQRFLTNPFAPDSRIYRTGDLARYRPDGTIELLGRTDHQVKIRGHRVELAEIETVLRKHPAIADCVTVAREDSPGDKRLVAYCIPAPGNHLNQAELLAFLGSRLPDYMRPSRFVELHRFPQTPNGKIDRASLPAPERNHLAEGETFDAPETDAEKRLAAIWSNLLGVDKIGRNDRFSEMGGDSFVAAGLFVQIEKEFGAHIPLSMILEDSALSDMALNLEKSGKIKPKGSFDSARIAVVGS